MLKRDELTDPNSCMSRARDDERTFVLLGRDVAAPHAIRAWAQYRIEIGKNKLDDQQIVEATMCAALMDFERDELVSRIAAGTTEAEIYRAHDADPAKVLAERDHFQERWQTAEREKAEMQARLSRMRDQVRELVKAAEAVEDFLDADFAPIVLNVHVRKLNALLRAALAPFRPKEEK